MLLISYLLFFSKLKTTPERGTLAHLWEFSWEEPKSWKSLQNAKSEYGNLRGENDLSWLWSVMIEPAGQLLFDRRLSGNPVFFTGEKHWSGSSFPWENWWGITINMWHYSPLAAKLHFHRDWPCPSHQMLRVGTLHSLLNIIRGWSYRSTSTPICFSHIS